LAALYERCKWLKTPDFGGFLDGETTPALVSGT
jgi:hypothetical protein